MRIIFRGIAIILAISVYGHLSNGKLFIPGLILALLFAFLGWKPKSNGTKKKQKTSFMTESSSDLSHFQNNFSQQEKGAMLYTLMLLVASE